MSTRRVGPWLMATLRQAAWAPVAVVLVHTAASKGFDVYDRFPDFDVPMHLLGGVAIAYWFHVASLRGSDFGVLGRSHRLTHCLLVFGMTCVAAVFWEFAEFLSDHYLGTRMQGGDLNDSLLDLLLGLVGGCVFLVGPGSPAGCRGPRSSRSFSSAQRLAQRVQPCPTR